MPEEYLAQLPTEARNPRSAHIDELSTLEMLTVINEEDATIAAAVRAALPAIAIAIDAISARFTHGGRLFYAGAGTSGRLGVLDASECPPTFSVPPGLFVGLIAGGDSALRKSSEQAEDSPEQGAADVAIHNLTPGDTVLGIAASGRTPYVLGALEFGNQIGALTIALTCAGRTNAGASETWENPPRLSPMAQLAQHDIELATGPEILTGSTRMKAGTATKLVLNMISTGVMIRQGAVFGNLMVNVQPTNAKLIDRAQRIIAAATSCDQPTAARLLREAGDVKTAIVMQQLQLPYAAAAARLKRHNGNLRIALAP
jgi:N-acetylmuramic acid 6-phosphate etherase